MNYESFVRKHLNLESISGQEARCLCVFHNDHKPSMYVNIHKGLFHCKSCGAKGHIKRISAALGLSELEESVPIGRLRERARELRHYPYAEEETAKEHIDDSWLDQFNFEHPYWTEDRQFSEQTIKLFRLGYDPVYDRLVIPMWDSKGRLLGAIWRRTPEQIQEGRKPKYLYPKGFQIGRYLHGAWLVRGLRSRVALVEGPLDAIACWNARVPSLALMGSRMTEDQSRLVRMLGIRTVVIMTDNDSAGIEAIQNVKDSLPGIGVKIGEYRHSWPAKDPGELTPRQIRTMFHSALPYHHWYSG